MNEEEVRSNLIEKMGIEDLPREKQEELIAKTSEVLLKKIFLATIDKLNETDQEILVDMVEQKFSQARIDSFVMMKIPNYSTYIQNIIENFFEDMRNATMDI